MEVDFTDQLIPAMPTKEDPLTHLAGLNRALTSPTLRRCFEQLRAEFPAQFAELCTVHLSFIIDVPADLLDEGRACQRLAAARSTSSLPRWLGLCDQLRTAPAFFHDGQPSCQLTVAESLLSLLTALPPGPEGQGAEGLFRKTGSILRQRHLRDSLAGGWPVDTTDLTPHDLAGALKCSLKELPEPLLTRRLLPYFQRLAAVPPAGSVLAAVQPARQLRGLRLLVQLLPARNRGLLGRLMGLLASVTRDPGTRMGPEALGTVFGPALLYTAAADPAWDPVAACASAAALNLATARLIMLGPALMEIPESVGIDAARALARLRARGRQPLRGQPADGRFDSEDDSDAVRLSLRFAECPEPDTDGFTLAQVAGLYAAVQGMPESGRKRRLIRRFNRCSNGGLSPHRLAPQRPRP